MSRLLLAICAGICLLSMRPVLMTAQEGTYDENALRVDQHRGIIRIVRGVSETVVLNVGAFRAVDLAGIVSPSPNAVAQAKIFEHDYRPGSWIASLGIATLGAAIGTYRIPDLNQVIPTALTIAGVSLITYGGWRLENAYRALSKSVWWYNRDLKK
jgi:F420-dependent methylenetetrahydromethanopterin dehydrogenase